MRREMIPTVYLTDPELLKGAMLVVSCANGKNDESFLGDLSLIKADGSFHADALPSRDVLNRFLSDKYVEPVPGQQDWYRKL